MNLFDDSTARNFDSSPQTMTPTNDSHTGGSAVLDAPEHAQPSPVELHASAEPIAETTTELAAETSAAKAEPAAPNTEADQNKNHQKENHQNSFSDSFSSGSDDFAAALEGFETESEESVGDD